MHDNPAKNYLETWLLKNNVNRAELSRRVGMNTRYVTNWFKGCGSEYAPVRVLHEIVQFPQDILDWVDQDERAEKAWQKMSQEARGGWSQGERAKYNPQPWPVTVAKAKQQPHPMHWRLVA